MEHAAEQNKPINCMKCGAGLRPLGLNAVACNCASFTVGVDDINAEAFYFWPVTLFDLKAIARPSANKLECPSCVSSWNWFDPRFDDRALFHLCVVLALMATDRDPTGSGGLAEKMYMALGGKIVTYKEIAANKRAERKAAKGGAK